MRYGQVDGTVAVTTWTVEPSVTEIDAVVGKDEPTGSGEARVMVMVRPDTVAFTCGWLEVTE